LEIGSASWVGELNQFDTNCVQNQLCSEPTVFRTLEVSTRFGQRRVWVLQDEHMDWSMQWWEFSGSSSADLTDITAGSFWYEVRTVAPINPVGCWLMCVGECLNVACLMFDV
jgi:hypothetical protein